MGQPSQTVARAYWRPNRPGQSRRRPPSEPTLVLMAGVPLVGKTTLARALVHEIATETVHVENDALRRLVVDAMDREEPLFDGDENHATYAAARQVIEMGLEEGVHVVHDATNLRETTRKQAFAIADRLGAPARVVFVDAPMSLLERRADQEGAAAQQALDALGHRRVDPEACTRSHIVLEGSDPPASNVELVLADPRFAVLQRPAEA